MTSSLASIYCDENGNTGEYLLDPAQPHFILAANDFSTDEAQELLEHVAVPSSPEVKFKTLRKTSAGISRLAKLLFDPRFNSSRITTFIIDKRFMVITKLVDHVLETMMHEEGYDLYRDGQNIATANMLYLCLPQLCGEAETEAVLQAFEKLIRFRTAGDIEHYIEAGQRLINAAKGEQLRQMLVPLFYGDFIPRWLSSIPSYAIDPAIPSLFTTIDAWGRRKLDRFVVVHDQSKPIIESESAFLKLMADASEESRLIGYDRRTFLFPLRASGLQIGDSKSVPQLQLSDICAGATSYLLKHQFAQPDDPLVKLITDAKCLDWAIGGVVPSAGVTPETLGTAGGSGGDPFAAMANRS